MKRLVVTAVGVLGMLMVSVPAQAIEILGTLSLAGRVQYDTQFDPDDVCGVDPAPCTNPEDAIIDFFPAGTGSGQGGVTLFGATGYFNGGADSGLPNDGLLPGAIGVIYDLTNVTSLATTNPPGPVDGSAPVTRWIDFANPGPGTDPDAEDLHFDLIGLVAQAGTDCAVAAVDGCIASGFFKLTETTFPSGEDGVNIAFNVLGQWHNVGDIGDYIGQFGAEFVGYTIQEIFDLIALGEDVSCVDPNEGNVGCSWSAIFVPVSETLVPEPVSLLLFGTGAAVLAARRRRQMRTK
jgi:hypothetical protein